MAIFGWDPPECIEARDCLARGLLAEAARVLLAAKDRDHRKVRELLKEVGTKLIEQAKKFYESCYQLEVADQLLDLASQCIQLDGEALVLQHQIKQQLYRRQQEKAWREDRLRQARQLKQNGNLNTALDILNELKEDPEVSRVRAEIQGTLQTYRRHLEGIEQSLAGNQPHAAHRHWQEAKKICPTAPELAEWAEKIAQQMAAASGGPVQQVGSVVLDVAGPAPAGPCRPLSSRNQSFLFGEMALVLSRGQIGIGSLRVPDVHLPLLGRVHQRHAFLLRDAQGWQIMPLADKQGTVCPVWVNGVLILAPQRIRHGDKIVLGGRSPGGSSCWQFSVPVPGSLTAVLESGPGNTSPICIAGHRMSKAVLLDDMLLVSSRTPAHLVLPDLPCQHLLFRWQSEGLCWQVEGGRCRLEIPGQTIDQPDSRLYLPGRLVIETAFDEAELLGRAAAGAIPATRMTLELKEVFVG